MTLTALESSLLGATAFLAGKSPDGPRFGLPSFIANTPPHSGLHIDLAHPPPSLRFANVNIGKVVHEPEDVQQPQHHGDCHHSIQD